MIEDDFYLSKTKVRASFEHAAKHYEKAAVLQREVGERMLNRLDLIRITPQAILDVGAGTGLQSNQLTKRYKKSTVITLDLSYAMLLQARHNKRLFNKQCLFALMPSNCLSRRKALTWFFRI